MQHHRAASPPVRAGCSRLSSLRSRTEHPIHTVIMAPLRAIPLPSRIRGNSPDDS
jgi:hypothetical protein